MPMNPTCWTSGISRRAMSDTLPLPDDLVAFAGPVLRQPDGMRMHTVPIPPEVFEALGAPRIVVGQIEGVRFRRAVRARRTHPHLALGRAVLREMGLSYGATAHVEIAAAPDPDAVHLPAELVEALRQDPEAAERFYGFTPGRQRSLAIHVSGAKRRETRERRALEIARKTRTHTLYSDR